ncbi:MAG: hypothetical protein KJ646_02045 [Nanoarchaeota archaeon]|nr:hypothetical protein [Nanoarchaeota archaeon]MBU4116866.1 hypothetical protein [Nanoarchaeota archaeon]
MIDKKEFASIIVISIILAFTLSLVQTWKIFLYTLLSIFLIILINILAKKITSYYLDSEIKIKIWEIKRFGFKAHYHLKRAFPAGAFFPVIFTAFSSGYFNWMACLIFDVKTRIYKAAKRHGLYSFSEIPEYHIGLIAASGIGINLFCAIIAYLIGFQEFAKLSIYYAFFNILPLSDLDGNKIFFGSLVMWSFLASLTLIGVIFALFVI